MDRELKRMWKEAVLVSFVITSWYLPDGTQKSKRR